MTCTLTKIALTLNEQIESVHICESRKLVALTTEDYKLKIYSYSESVEELSFLREFKNHSGQIFSVVFAPISHHTYILTIGYDKALYLYNLDDSKQNDAVFSFIEEDEKIGYFTCAAFVPTEKGKLVFLAGTSSGHLFVFESVCNFEAKMHSIFKTPMKCISANQSGDLILTATSSLPRFVSNFQFADHMEIGENGQNLLKTTSFVFFRNFGQSINSLALSVSEDHTVGIWEFDDTLKIFKSLQVLEFPSNVISAHWNFSGNSASVFCGKKEERIGDLKVFTIYSENSETDIIWKTAVLDLKSD